MYTCVHHRYVGRQFRLTSCLFVPRLKCGFGAAMIAVTPFIFCISDTCSSRFSATVSSAELESLQLENSRGHVRRTMQS